MIELPEGATLRDVQDYIHALEARMGWLEVDLVRTCFLMGEEVGELFKAVRRVEGRLVEGEAPPQLVGEVAEELVDVLNYLAAVANRLGIDLEAAFRAKNLANQRRTWP